VKLGDTDRLEAFSDGVMAVIITIMAFSIPTPEASTSAALRALVPHVLVYVLSFVMVAIYWVNHHHLLRSAERITEISAILTIHPVNTFCAGLIAKTGVLLLPGTLYGKGYRAFRVGYGRRNLPDALARFEEYMTR